MPAQAQNVIVLECMNFDSSKVNIQKDQPSLHIFIAKGLEKIVFNFSFKLFDQAKAE